MSSEISTNSGSLRQWHVFVLVALFASAVGVVMVRPDSPALLVLLVAICGSVAVVGLGIYRTVWPLATREFRERTEMVGSRTRAALDQKKTLILRSIKELEFDRAMGKVSTSDFEELSSRLRARAIELMKQLDIDTPNYYDLIERELAERLVKTDQGVDPGLLEARQVCDECGAGNDIDARFCKSCGLHLHSQD